MGNNDKGFYQFNNKILKFDVNKDIEKIRFNHYIMQKENYQRLKGDLPRGQFYITVRNVYDSLNLSSTRRANELIKYFEDSGIIKPIFKSNSKKKPSIYSYIAVGTVTEADSETDSETVEASKNKDLGNKHETVCETDTETVTETSKKEYRKTINKKNIYIYSPNSNEFRLASYLLNFIKRNNPKAKEPDLQKWSKQIDYILRIDKREVEEVKSVIKWCQNDDFWFKNILSPEKLRKHYDQLVLQMGGKKVQNGNDGESNKKNYDWYKTPERQYETYTKEQLEAAGIK